MRTLAFCRSDSERNYYAPLAARQHQFDWAVAVSEECRSSLASRIPDKADRIRCVPTFVDRPEHLARTWQRDSIRLIFVGRLVHQDKRVLDLLRLVPALLSTNVDFTLSIVGEGPMVLPLLEGFAKIRHRGRVHIVGTIAPADMGALYARHDIFVQLSDTEGLSNALIEAMANGVVPVATRTRSGIAGLVTHGVDGLLVEIGAIAAMAEHIALLSRSESAAEAMGAAAHRATEAYGWEPYRDRLEQLLGEIDVCDSGVGIGPRPPSRLAAPPLRESHP